METFRCIVLLLFTLTSRHEFSISGMNQRNKRSKTTSVQQTQLGCSVKPGTTLSLHALNNISYIRGEKLLDGNTLT